MNYLSAARHQRLQELRAKYRPTLSREPEPPTLTLRLACSDECTTVVKRMKKMATIVQQRFEDYRDNPMVQGLLVFVRDTLQRDTKDITNWSIEMSESNYRGFQLQFGDGTQGCKGYIARGSDNVWRVHTFTPEEVPNTYLQQPRIAVGEVIAQDQPLATLMDTYPTWPSTVEGTIND